MSHLINGETYYTVTEVAEMYDYHPSHVRWLARTKTKELGVKRRGRNWLFNTEAIDKAYKGFLNKERASTKSVSKAIDEELLADL